MYGSQPYAPLIRSDMGSEYGEENWTFVMNFKWESETIKNMKYKSRISIESVTKKIS